MLVRFDRFPVPSGHGLFGFDRPITEILEALEGDSFLPLTRRGEPSVDIAEEKDSTVLTLEVPGVSKADLKITVADRLLTVAGHRKPRALPDESRWIRNEVGSGPFSRSFRLAHPVSEKEISAELKDGMLRIVLPKAEEARPREIPVR